MEYKTTRNNYGRDSEEAMVALSAFNTANHAYRNYSKYRQSSYELKLANLIPEP